MLATGSGFTIDKWLLQEWPPFQWYEVDHDSVNTEPAHTAHHNSDMHTVTQRQEQLDQFNRPSSTSRIYINSCVSEISTALARIDQNSGGAIIAQPMRIIMCWHVDQIQPVFKQKNDLYKLTNNGENQIQYWIIPCTPGHGDRVLTED